MSAIRALTTPFCVAVASTACFGTARASAAVLPPLDSSAFEYRFEGDQELSGLAEFDVDGGGSTRTTDGDLFTFSNTLGSPPILLSTVWAANADDAIGWTFEWRVRVRETATAVNTQLFIGDGDDGGASRVFRFNTDGIRMGVSESDPFVPMDLTTFHTVRISQAPGSDTFEVFLDGVSAGTVGAGPYGAGNFWFGAGSLEVQSDIDVDYLRFTVDGGFAPIPEPASLTALAVAAMTFLRRRRA